MDARDFWEELPERVQAIYLKKAEEFHPVDSARIAEEARAKITLAEAVIERERVWEKLMAQLANARSGSINAGPYYAANEKVIQLTGELRALLDSA